MNIFHEPSVISQAFDPSPWEAEAVQGQPGLQRIRGQPGLYREMKSQKKNNKNKHHSNLVVFISAANQVCSVAASLPVSWETPSCRRLRQTS